MLGRYRPVPQVQALTKWLDVPWEEVPATVKQEAQEGLRRYERTAPQISVVMIGRNEEARIFAALLSLARVELPVPTELVVVDNGSTDSMPLILNDLGVKTVRETTAGWTPARNAGLQAARGEIILTADSDNLYPPQWVVALSAPLRKNPDMAVTCSEYCFYTRENRYPISLHLYQYLRLVNNLMRQPKRPHLNCLGGTMGFRREQALEVGGYRAPGAGEDGELAFRLARLGKIVFVRDKRALAYASLRSVFRDGDFFRAFRQRLRTHLVRLFAYFSTQKNG